MAIGIQTTLAHLPPCSKAGYDVGIPRMSRVWNNKLFFWMSTMDVPRLSPRLIRTEIFITQFGLGSKYLFNSIGDDFFSQVSEFC